MSELGNKVDSSRFVHTRNGYSNENILVSWCARPSIIIYKYVYVTIFGKIDHLRASNEIHFLPVQERYIHTLSRNTNCLTIDCQVCFYRWLFTDAVKPRGCILRSWGALIGLHGVPNCSSRQSWPPLWILSVHVTY